MQRYMKSEMPYRGVSMPRQRAIWRELFPRDPLPSRASWRQVVLELWRGASFREERYAAIALAEWKPCVPYLTYEAIPLIEELIVGGAWWDYVDWLATHHLGTVLAHERAAGRAARMNALMKRWARDPCLWKRRAAILCQIRFKADTDLELLYACIEPNLEGERSERPASAARATAGKPERSERSERPASAARATAGKSERPAFAARATASKPERSERSERSERPERSERSERSAFAARATAGKSERFFLRKAIGWALRQYAWTDPGEVRRYVRANRAGLSSLSVREALRNTGDRRQEIGDRR
jgi:3-methyladenine DNA glycosylase AlkD